MELKLAVGYSTTKVKFIKNISIYLELHFKLSTFNLSTFIKAISIYTIKYNNCGYNYNYI